MEDLDYIEMRQQMAVLKEHLDNQEIVSDQLLREVMKMKTKDINYTKNAVVGAAVFGLLIIPLSMLLDVWSLPFTIATCLMMVFCAVATYWIHRPVEQLNFMTTDLATVARVMATFKKHYDNWLHYVAPALLIPWLSWACYEMGWKFAPEGSNPWLMFLPVIIGAAIGAMIGYRYHCKAVNAAQSILDQIEEV
jgi:hypothetical protein